MRSPSVFRTTLLASLLFAFLSSPGIGLPTPLSAQDPDPRTRAVEGGIARAIQVQGREPQRFTIWERMETYDVPGISVAVLNEGRIVWAKGYGVTDADSGEPVTAETLFQAASISKPVAATAALRLVQEGRLELDTPVNRYLRDWKIPDNDFTAQEAVTLRHLLTHTGGLTVHGFPGYAVSAELASTVEVLDGSGPANTGPIRVDTLPGSLWRYSGGGYTIMQKLLEDVTGMPFPQILRELVLDPAGMTLSSYEQPLLTTKAALAATAHLSDGSPAEGKWHIYPEMAAAGLWTNPTELAMLAMELQEAFHGEMDRVLSPEMTRSMLTGGMGGYGLGFRVSGEGDEARFSHGGSNHGFRAQFTAFLEGGRGIFVMTNGDRGSPLAQEIALAAAREFDWPMPRYREVILSEVRPEILQEIAGEYRIEEQDLSITVEVVEDHLRANFAGLQVIDLHPTAERFFIDLIEGTHFRVDRDEEGKILALQIVGGPRAIRVGG